MPNVVRVVLFELFRVNVTFPRKFRLPELKRLFHGEADAFKEETELKTAEMLQVVLTLQGCEKSLDAGWERLARVKVQIGELDLVLVSGRLGFVNVEVNGVVVGQRHQHCLEARVFQNYGQELVSFYQLLRKSEAEVGRRDRVQLAKRHIGYTLMNVDGAATDERECFFEGHLDEAAGLFIFRVGYVKPNTFPEFLALPLWVTLLHRLVTNAEMNTEQLLDFGGFARVQSHGKEASFLGEEPLS